MGFIAGNYVLAFLDILGQQDKLKQITRMPETEKDINEFYRLISDTYGHVDSLKTMYFRLMAEIYHENSPSIVSKIRPEIKSQRFSDSLLIFHNVFKSSDKIPIIGIYYLIATCGMLMLSSLAEEYSIRGGIELGIGMEPEDNYFYGPVLSEAYNIESCEAIYPRIVIGNKLYDYIVSQKDIKNDLNQEIYTTMANRTLELIKNDNFDNKNIVHFLSNKFMNLWPDKNIVDKLLQRILKYIELQMIKFKSDTKILYKYELLKKYYNESVIEK